MTQTGWGNGLAKTLWASIDRHGRISTHRRVGASDEAFQDYYPGQVLLALAEGFRAGLTELDIDKVDRAFRFYTHRFNYKRSFGQVCWMTQAACAWFTCSKETLFLKICV